jgi:hypothetical protein
MPLIGGASVDALHSDREMSLFPLGQRAANVAEVGSC